MPELPEVETIKRDLEAALTGKTLRAIEVFDTTLLTGHSLRGKFRRKISIESFQKSVSGKTVQQFKRRGKYIVMEFEDATALILHLRMTGQLLLSPPKIQERALFHFDGDSKLWFVDRRRFGEMVYSEDWKSDPSIRTLGPEPLTGELNGAFLKSLLNRRQTPIHSALLDQRVLSGLGNIYVVESLHRSKILPTKQAGKVTLPQLELLSRSIVQVLNDSIRNRGYSMHTYVDAMGKKGRSQLFTLAYGKEGKPCASCGTALKRRVVTGRGVVYCSACQK